MGLWSAVRSLFSGASNQPGYAMADEVTDTAVRLVVDTVETQLAIALNSQSPSGAWKANRPVLSGYVAGLSDMFASDMGKPRGSAAGALICVQSLQRLCPLIEAEQHFSEVAEWGAAPLPAFALGASMAESDFQKWKSGRAPMTGLVSLVSAGAS